MELFKKAVLQNTLFKTNKGFINVIDLCQLPLKANSGEASLNNTARRIHTKLTSGEELDFTGGSNTVDAELVFKLDVVKAVITHKLDEVEIKTQNSKLASQRHQYNILIAKKEAELHEGKPLAQLIEERDNLPS